jgi:uncharacterized protein YdhG (YjbR/CyaY superfamily)
MRRATSKGDAKSSASATDVDAFLAALPEAARTTLEKLRRTIRAAVPKATEAISYGVPTFKHQGRPLVGFGATKNHCALYVMSPEVMRTYAAELAKYDTSKGTIRFPASKPLPAALVRKLVEARIAEIETAKSGYGGT